MAAGPCERSARVTVPTRRSMVAGRRVSNGGGSVMTPGPAIENGPALQPTMALHLSENVNCFTVCSRHTKNRFSYRGPIGCSLPHRIMKPAAPE